MVHFQNSKGNFAGMWICYKNVRVLLYSPCVKVRDKKNWLDIWQVVVLARIIPDEEQALSSAAGIKLLVDLLQDSSNNETLSLAADCIARLAHTRAGECKSGEVKELKVMHGHCYWSHNCHYDS